MKREVANTRGLKHGNSSYAILSSVLWNGDLQIETDITNLPYSPTIEDFFITVKEGVLDDYDTIIRFTKAGYLKITLKTTVFTNGGTVDIQIYKNNDNTVYARRSFNNDGYAEIYLETSVSIDDEIIIALKSTVAGALLKYAPAAGYFQVQPAYIINFELIQTNIGNVFYSIDPNLEVNIGGCVKLDQVRQLLIADYPILYEKIKTTPYMIAGSDIDGIYFSIIDFTQYPYLRAGATLDTLGQNLPDPQITASSNSMGAGTVDFGGNNYGGTSAEPTGTFSGSTRDDSTDWGGEAAAGSGFPTTNIHLKLASHIHTISVNQANGNYTSDQNVRPNTSQMYAYMNSDK